MILYWWQIEYPREYVRKTFNSFLKFLCFWMMDNKTISSTLAQVFSGSHVFLIYDIWMSRNLMIFLEQVFTIAQVAHRIREVMDWKRILKEKPSSCSLMHYIDKENPRSFQETMKRSIRYLWSRFFVFFDSSFHLLLHYEASKGEITVEVYIQTVENNWEWKN